MPLPIPTNPGNADNKIKRSGIPTRPVPTSKNRPSHQEAQTEDDSFQNISLDDLLDDDNFEGSVERIHESQDIEEVSEKDDDLIDYLTDSDDEEDSEIEPQVKTPRRSKKVEDYSDDDEDDDEDNEPKKKTWFKNKNDKNSKSKKSSKNKKPSSRKKKKIDYDENQPDFVDKKRKILLPFGGNSSKKKVGENQIDPRKDAKNKAKIIQISVLGLISLLVLIGGYNALKPSDAVNANYVDQAILSSKAEIDFPRLRAQSFVKDFISSYLSVNNGKSDPNLSYFYKGKIANANDVEGDYNTVVGSFSQKVLMEPMVIDEKIFSSKSAAYEVGALVQQEPYFDPNVDYTSDQRKNMETAAQGTAKWVYFNVSLYYERDSKTLFITPDSPVMITGPNVGDVSKVPNGTITNIEAKSDELAAQVRNILLEWVDDYSKSSEDNYSLLENEFVTNYDKSMRTGLDNEFTYDESDVTVEAYSVLNDPNKIKAIVGVTWIDKQQTTDSNTSFSMKYPAKYTVELDKSEGRWLISGIKPFNYYVQ